MTLKTVDQFFCMTLIIPSLATKYSAVQKISCGQTFTDILNLRCDLDLKCSNLIFPQDTLAYDAVLSNQVRLQMDWQFRRYNQKSLIYTSPRCDLDTEHSEPIFLHDTLAYNAAAQPYQVWQQNILWFRRYCPDKHSLAFWPFAVTLTLNAVIPFFHRTLQLMMLCYNTNRPVV